MPAIVCAAALAVSLAVADAQKAPAPKGPPAQLVVPEELRKEREAEEKQRRAAQALGLTSPEVLAAAGPLEPHVGEWVEYAVSDAEVKTRMRMSVLAAPGEAAGRYWLEVATVGETMLPTALKLLVHGSPSQPGDIERMLLYAAGQAPIDVPIDEAREQMEADRAAATHVQVKKLGKADVKVPGGTFAAERLRVKGEAGQTQLWLARGAVPLWGLVRAQSGGRTIELMQFGKTGAHSVIPEQGAPAAADQGNGSESVK